MSPTATTDTHAAVRRPGGQVTFLGAGPGDPGLLTLRAVEVLASADVLVADPLTAEAVRGHCPAHVEVHQAAEYGAESSAFVLDEEPEALGRLLSAVKAGKHVVRTVDGDPGLAKSLVTLDLAARRGRATEARSVRALLSGPTAAPPYLNFRRRGSCRRR